MGYLLYTIFSIILILLSIVTIHELGHYLIARLLNVKISEFSVGIGRVKFLPKYVDSRGTVWRIGLLPLGGYVSILAENPKNEDDTENQSEPSVLPEWFYNIINSIFEAITNAVLFMFGWMYDSKMPNIARVKGVYLNDLLPIYRAGIAIAGPLSNYLLSIFLLFSIYSLVGRETHKYTITQNNHNFIVNDMITAVDNNREILNKSHLMYLARENSQFSAIRDGQIIKINGKVDNIQQVSNIIRLNANDSIRFAFRDANLLIKYTLSRLFGFIWNKSRKAPKLSGPIGIIQQGIGEINKGIYYLVYWTAVLSLSFCVLNLIFIPPFDGGAILLNIIEMIFGKNRKIEEIAQNIALIVILYFLISTTQNDLINTFKKPLVIRSQS